MTTTERKTAVLQRPKPEIADRGTVRLGGGIITSEFPPLQPPTPEIAIHWPGFAAVSLIPL